MRNELKSALVMC